LWAREAAAAGLHLEEMESMQRRQKIWEGIAAEDNASFNLSTFMHFLSRFGMLG